MQAGAACTPSMSASRFPAPIPARLLFVWLLGIALLIGALPARAQTTGDALVLEARDALRRHDRTKLAAARTAAIAAQHPLAPWIDYWELGNRLSEVRQDEVEAFYARWPGSYVEDRLRNDWLLELGHRRDWANFAREFPRFRMNDDREVTCYAVLSEHMAGRNVVDAARAAWYAQRDVDEGCTLLATVMIEAKRFTQDDIWRAARLAVEFNRPRVARLAANFINLQAANAVTELLDQPARYLTRRANVSGRLNAELTALAVMRMAWNDPEAAAGQLEQRWQLALPPELASIAWATVAKQAAIKLMPEAVPYYQLGWKAGHRPGQPAVEWTDDALGWAVRSALRSGRGTQRWSTAQSAIAAMSAAEQREPVWVYWKARALAALAKNGPEGDADRTQSRQLLESIAGQLNFYGLLATEELGQPIMLPPKPAPLTMAERVIAQGNPGLSRSLQLISLGLRSEGVREWNYMLRGMSDRELLAAAQLACEREVWDRCINTSDRTRSEIDLDQRFPTPFRTDVLAKAAEIGIDPAYVYGLIRQESRFVMDARSAVGASGLMQLMPATAKWTAKKLGVPFTPTMITDREQNIRLGTGYLKLVLDDFGGSQPLAAAAYNAGPSRSRRWRDGPVLEPAIWAENIPFNETRDYVKKVLTNAVLYASVLTGQPASLKARLGASIGPRDAGPAVLTADLP